MKQIFTDGACSVNPGPGGWAYIIKNNGIKIFDGVGYDPATTNNRMEMKAVIAGLAMLTLKFGDNVEATVVSDSAYVINGITKWIHGWKKKDWINSSKKPVKNKDLWEEIDELNNRHKITWEHVRGHQGHPENEECDRMAVQAYKEMQ
tara:strand:- start:245 stop:688 length:444 start_codon:yes stop_codon:yes gene_type:complete